MSPVGVQTVKAGVVPAVVVSPPPRLLDRVRHAIRVRHFAIRTEQTYVDWVRRFILFHGKRHPQEMGVAEVEAFLTHLAVERGVAASTQNQAKAALLFLYREVLGEQLPWLDGVVSAKASRRLPVVLTPREVGAMLAEMSGTTGLLASLLYGTGMRLLEGLRLRVKDIEFERRELLVRDGKGSKDRVTDAAREHDPAAARAAGTCARASRAGSRTRASAPCGCPMRWRAKYPTRGARLGLAVGHSRVPRARAIPAAGTERRHHLNETSIQKAVGRRRAPRGYRQALLAACAAPLLRHPPAAGGLRHPHRAGTARPQRRETTMIYTHVLNRGGRGVLSPLDRI